MSPRRQPRRFLSIAHSYCVALNRRLATEIAHQAAGRWEVTVAAPRYMDGDLRTIELEAAPDNSIDVIGVTARFTRLLPLLSYGRELKQLMGRGWDLVHCWEEPYWVAGWQAARWTPKSVPFVFWTFQNVAKRYPVPFSWMEQYCLDRCAGWQASGITVLETQMSRGYGGKPHMVCPLGVDIDHFRPDRDARNQIRRQLGWGAEALVVGFLGRFVADKGLPLLLDALDQTKSRWHALFVGSGPLEMRLRQWARRYGDRARVVVGVRHDQVPAYLNAMDALCAPSQTTSHWREQLGRMLLEGFACGVPVIASDSGEIPHVVGRAGIILPELAPSQWANTIDTVLNDSGCRSELSAAGLDRARTEYAWPIIARRHLSFLEAVA
jgi:glycosyltransferase involved in cell wall biosynthesis